MNQVGSTSKPKVFVLGNFVQACCWSVPRLPNPGETLVASAVHIEPGGKGLNVAICLQRLGLSVSTLIGCGKDAAGVELLALLAKEGVGAQHVHQFTAASGWGSGWIAADGQNAIAVYPGANLSLSTEQVELARVDIAAASVVYGQFETSMVAVEAAFKHAHSERVMTVLNPSPWQPVSAELRLSTHTIIVNETEAKGILGLSSSLQGLPQACCAQIASKLGQLWTEWPSVERMIVTLGESGCLGFERQDKSVAMHVSAPKILAVDTVGAGDAFSSGFCAAIASGEDLETSLRWGNLCGAHLASKSGVLGALPDRSQLLDLLAQPDTTAAKRISITVPRALN